MKTPYLDEEIEKLSSFTLNNYGKGILTEYKAIKKQLENNPIVSTPDNPVWVVDETGQKRILLADFGENCIYRYITVTLVSTHDFLSGKNFDWNYCKNITPYIEKVSIEVTKDEAVKVEEFLKTLRNEK